MSEVAEKEVLGTKRLVLGYDGGCFTCSDLASRIEERVGEKVEVRSLRDPQVAEWRRRALGENAPWAPTLIEVKGPKVRVWTGRKMGFALSRRLGPVATWRVLQVLGEVGAAQEVEGSPVVALVRGMSRRQFLKGVAGAAVAVSVLPSGALFPSTAEAGRKPQLKNATSEQRKKAIDIVRDSNQYQNLKKDLNRKTNRGDATFDFDKAVVKVGKSGNFGVVRVVADYARKEKVADSAVFIVDYEKKKAMLSGGAEFTPHGDREIKVASLSERNLPSSHRHAMVGARNGKKYVRIANGREMTPEQFKKEMERLKKRRRRDASQREATQGTITVQQEEPDSPYEQCLVDTAASQQATSDFCDTIGLGLDALDLFSSFIPVVADLVFDTVSLATDVACIQFSTTAPTPEEACADYPDDG